MMNKTLLIAGIIMVLALAGAGAVMIGDAGVNAEAVYTGNYEGEALLCDPSNPNCEPPDPDPCGTSC